MLFTDQDIKFGIYWVNKTNLNAWYSYSIDYRGGFVRTEFEEVFRNPG